MKYEEMLRVLLPIAATAAAAACAGTASPGPDASADVPPAGPVLPLRVEGRHIVDSTGARVRLTGVNWDGAHQEDLVPKGLDLQTPAAIAARLRGMGFNSVRLTYSDAMVRDEPVPAPARLAANPGLVGKGPLAAFDAVVEALAAEGILVILNNHMSDAGWCCSDTDGNGLWYNERFSEADWIADWVELAGRYRHVPEVVGADLRNEPRRPATWGGVAETDWPSAAERCGSAILAANPDLILFVEGINYAIDLTGAATRPLALPADRLAFSAHDYPWSAPGTVAQTYEQYVTMVDAMWGYLAAGPSPAPVWLGEFGCFHREIGNKWWPWVRRYVQERDLDWSLWGLFAYDGGSWGLLDPGTLEPADRAFREGLRAFADPPGAFAPTPAAGGPALPVEWIDLPGGTLSMGAEDLGASTRPVHDVTVPPFRISRTEVTIPQYRACEAAGACGPRAGTPQEPVDRWGDGVPAQWMTWGQARAFCAFAVAGPDRGRLCTEAEWEWAARYGADDDGVSDGAYPWGAAAPACGTAVWSGPGCVREGPEPPCSRPASTSARGVCDLAGNVLEWVEDDWHPSHDGAPADGAARIGSPRAEERVLRGGSYAHDFADGLRGAYRDRANAGDAAAMFGARCCASP